MRRKFTKLSVLTFLCFFFINAAFAQDIIVKGTVTDSQDKTTIPSVSIKVKGSTRGAQTDASGKYAISVPANGILVFTYIGYNTQEIPVNNQTTVNVTMASTSQQLEQVVVVGYGTQRKIDVTGSVASVKGEEISKQASQNPVSSLQGKVAGVAIANVGTPGGTPKITIRGTGTIYGKTNVLYVVDGVWYDDINFLNPSDIANISILKDASSQSIFGIRAANGVVLVTTIHGKTGDATINYNGTVGIQRVTNAVKMADASEYAIGINELYATLNKSRAAGEQIAPLFSNTNLGKGTDWYDQVLRTAMVTNHQVSINGATEKSSYNFSLGYLNQDGIVENNNYKRYTARLSNEFQVFKSLKIGYNVTGTSSVSKDAPGAIFRNMYAASPVVPVFNADGSYGDPAAYQLGNGSDINPQATLDFFNQTNRQYKVTGNVFAELKFANHFTFKTSFGGDFAQEEVRGYAPVYKATVAQQNNVSALDVDRIETRNWIIENTLTYTNKWGDHNLTLLAGQTAQRFKSYEMNAKALNVPYSSDGDLYLSLGNSGNILDKGSINTIASYFGRANYSFANKYLLNASIRRDGSSQFFGGGDEWSNFPAVGAGWVISNEDFMKDQKIFSNLKLRGSWGIVGNSGVPTNITTLKVTQNPAFIAYYNHIPQTGANINTIVAPSLVWERGVGTDVGLEMGFLTNRLNVEVDYYNRTTERAIFDVTVLGSLGLDGQLIANQADIRNRGFEFVASWADKTSGGLSYSVSANVSLNNNKVLNVTSGNNPIDKAAAGLTNGIIPSRTIQGQSIGMFYGYQVAGIYQTDAEAKAAFPVRSDLFAGDFNYVDQNGDGIINGKDRVFLGNPNPKYTYGINSTFAYKNFDLAVDIQGVAGVDVYNANLGARFGNENFTQDFFEHRWHGEGTSNTYPSTNIGGSTNNQPNSFYVESGAYIRLRNVQLGYTLPQALISKWKMQKLRVFASAQNALNLFGYKGFSPEVGGAPTTAGVDINVYPLFATYNIGVNLTF